MTKIPSGSIDPNRQAELERLTRCAELGRLTRCAELGQVVPIDRSKALRHYQAMLDELSATANDVHA